MRKVTERIAMKSLKVFWVGFFSLMIVGAFAGCEKKAAQSPDVSDSIRKSLDQAGLKDVSVSQDRDQGVVTLGGHVPADADKSQAESIAKAIAAGEVVADQIAVIPPGGESAARAMNADLDTGIKKNLDAALIQNGLHKDVKYDVKNGVVTLTGKVSSRPVRAQAEQLASSVPNVKQVVNELQTRSERATSSN
jgi:hyperosmotically inducible periplasmic protein